MLKEAMKSSVITTDKSDATEQVKKYNIAARTRSLTIEERASLTTLRQLKKGKKVIDLYRVFKQVALDEKGRPKLALANASWKWCYYYRNPDDVIFSKASGGKWEKRTFLNRYDVPTAFMAGPTGTRQVEIRGRAVVPTIPPNLVPLAPLKEFHILFEAEWEDVPTDPILLQNIKGTNNLFVVLAHWDLTETERSVLAGRFDARS